MGWTLDFLRERLLGWIQDQGGWVRPLTLSPTPLGPLGLPELPTVVYLLPIFGSSDVICNVSPYMSDQSLIYLVPGDLCDPDLMVTPDLPVTPDLTSTSLVPSSGIKFFDNNSLTLTLQYPLLLDFCPYSCPLTSP